MANEGIELEVYSYANPNTRIDFLENRVNPECLKQLEGNGGGSFSIAIDDPKIRQKPQLLDGRNVVKVKVDGEVQGGFLIDGRKSTTIGSGEKAQEAYQIIGEGLKQWLNDGQIQPWTGWKRRSLDKRSFSFASPTGSWYNPSQWVAPTRVIRQNSTNKSFIWKNFPTEWPSEAPHVWWVWSSASLTNPAPLGDNYFRFTFDTIAPHPFSLYIAADDAYAVWVDGALVGEYSDFEGATYHKTQKVDFNLDAGTHVIGIRVNNASHTAGLLAALFWHYEGSSSVDLGTATIAVGTNALVTRANHGLPDDTKVHFETTGTLPKPLVADRDYYVTEATTNSFRLATKPDGPAIDTSGTQSGTHTLIRTEVPSRKGLITYTGLDSSMASSNLTTAQGKEADLLAAYNALPNGSTAEDATDLEKQRHATKYAAKVAWQKAVTDRKIWQKDVAAAARTNHLWRVLPYPTTVPGWSIGGMILKLLDEAEARGVLMPTWLTPTFTSTHDSNGVAWGDALDWSFDVGKDSILTAVQKIEELGYTVWINPVNYELNIVAERGEDRTVYDNNGPAGALRAPIIFEKGKNLSRAEFEARSKIKNKLSVKFADGYFEVPLSDAPSIAKYGVIEGHIDTDASIAVTRELVKVIFEHKATEEEGATYTIITTDKIPGIDFHEGDWVLAPDERNQLVPRRVMSIAVGENDNGRPTYVIEFDTIFEENETRLAQMIDRLGGGGTGGGYANSGGGGGGRGAGSPVIFEPDPGSPTSKVPKRPLDVEAVSIGGWSANGVNAVSEVTLTWDPVTEYTDEEELIPTHYEVHAKLTSDNDGSWVLYTTTPEPPVSIRAFLPGQSWDFKIVAVAPENPSEFSDPITHVMSGPIVAMPAPEPPTLSSTSGILVAKSNGLLVGGQVPPPQFRYFYAKVALVTGGVAGTYERAGNTISREGRDIQIPRVVVGSTYSVVLIAVDGAGIESAPSTAVQHTVTGVEATVGQNIIDAIEEAQDTADEAYDEAAAAGTLAGTKNKIFFNLNTETAPVATALGDMWWVRNADLEIIEVRVAAVLGDPTTWVPYRLVADTVIVPGSAGEIVLGNGSITAPKIVASEEMWAAVLGAHKIIGEEILFGTMNGNHLTAGSIDVIHLSNVVGQELDISSNTSVNIIVSGMSELQSQVDANGQLLGEMTTYYEFGPTGAIISTPDSPFSVAIRSDRIEMLEQGVPVSWWENQEMHVRSLIGEIVVLGNHQFEKYGTGTVMRKL